MRRITLLLALFVSVQCLAQVKLCAWNIQNFGRSKSDSEVVYMAGKLKEFDLVAIVEVVAGDGGAQAVARLADELNRSGAKWDYRISDPTTGTPGSAERYAFLWKTHRLKISGRAWLDSVYRDVIEREPYFATFVYGENEFTVGAFHAIPKAKQPEREIRFFKFYPTAYPGKTLIFCGDFNCSQSHTVFNPLKSTGYLPALVNCKTSLRMKETDGECLASEYDNLFYPGRTLRSLGGGVVPFYRDFPSLRAARMISDHLPVYLEFDFHPRDSR